MPNFIDIMDKLNDLEKDIVMINKVLITNSVALDIIVKEIDMINTIFTKTDPLNMGHRNDT